MKRLMVAVTAVCAIPALAFDASTEAFYAFRDAAPGTSAVDGMTITNTLDATAHAGTVSLTGSGTVTFSADAPGDYILNGVNGETIACDPQSISFDGTAAADGGKVSLADIMTALRTPPDPASLNNAFTIEFFFKKPTTLAGNDNASSIMCSFAQSATKSLRVFAPYTAPNQVALFLEAARTATLADPLQDGKWHHVSVTGENVYDKDKWKSNTLWVTVDYTNVGFNAYGTGYPTWFNVDGPLDLGGGARFRGNISCLRVSHKLLTADQMLRATPKADPVQLTGLREDTAAFYAFDDAAPGWPLDSDHTVLNAAAPARFAGTPTIHEAAGSEGVAVCRYTTDRPGKYVFDGAGYLKTPFLTNPRSLYIWGSNPDLSGTVTAGAKVSFAGLASEILSNAEYTVEFFYKIPSTAKRYNWFSQSFTWSSGSAEAQSHGIRLPTHTNGQDSMNKVSVYVGTTGRQVVYPARISDDRWHHVAVVRKGGKVRLFCDYAQATGDDFAEPVEVTATALPFVLADNYRYFGYVSCLRVVKKALAPGEMLFASDDEHCLSDPTVAYWTFDGTPGASIPVASSTVTNAAAFAGQYFAKGLDNGARPRTAASQPIVTNTTAFRRNSVFVGGEKLRSNASAATIGWVANSQSVLTLYPTNHVPVRSGSFTFETFYRFDADGWTAHKTGSTYCTIAGKPSNDTNKRAYDWWGGIWNYSGGALQLNVATNAAADVTGGTVYTTAAVDGRWHHFAVVYDEANLTAKLYFDYAEKISLNLKAPMPRAVDPSMDRLTIGHGGDGSSTPFLGTFDEMRYSRVALAPEQFLRAKSDLGMLLIVR